MKRGIMRVLTLALSAALVVSLVACSTVKGNEGTTAAPAATAQSFKAGAYTATAKGHGGDITVRVTFSGSAIESVVIAQADETSGVGAPALKEISDKIVKGQTLDIDTVSGATSSSDARGSTGPGATAGRTTSWPARWQHRWPARCVPPATRSSAGTAPWRTGRSVRRRESSRSIPSR